MVSVVWSLSPTSRFINKSIPSRDTKLNTLILSPLANGFTTPLLYLAYCCAVFKSFTGLSMTHFQKCTNRPSSYIQLSGHLFPNNSFNLREASKMLSLCPNALALTNPSPPGPNPLPGVVTMLAFSRISENTSHELLPGNCTHT